MTVPFKQMPTYMLRDGSAIPGGVEGYVFLVLVNRMATRDGSVRYKGLNVQLLENQACCTLQDIAKITGYTEKRVRTAIKNLEKRSILGKATGIPTKGNLSIYSIDFSNFERPEWQSYGQTKGKPRANQGQTELETIKTIQTVNHVEPPAASPLPFDKKYKFEGKVIRLKPEDYDRWEKSFPAIPDINAELVSLDEFYNGSMDGDQKKKWFLRCATALKNANQKYMERSRVEAERFNGGPKRKASGMAW